MVNFAYVQIYKDIIELNWIQFNSSASQVEYTVQ